MLDLKEWPEATKKISAISIPITEKKYLFKQFSIWSIDLGKKLYFWHSGYEFLQEIVVEDLTLNYQILPTDRQINLNFLFSRIVSIPENGIFLLFGLEKLTNSIYILDRCLEELPKNKHLVLIDEQISLPSSLGSLIPIFNLNPPDSAAIAVNLRKFFSNNSISLDVDKIATACLGLHRGEIENIIRGENLSVLDTDRLLDRIHEYKRERLKSRGIEVFANPPVPYATGLENLDREIEDVNKLFSSQAAEKGLSPPRGWLFWGIPGVGKSLVAKLIANRINATLVSFDWSSAIDSSVRDSLANLDYVFKTCGSFGRCVLFLDEFDKAIGDALESGGIAAKLYRKLLIWMQEHRDPVLTIATINYLEYLKPELVRRFDQVFFFDLPHNGTIFETFKLYLSKFSLSHTFSEMDWRKLLRAYRGCTQYEISRAVENCAKRLFCQGRSPWVVLLEDLLEERTYFSAAAENNILSDQIYDIKQNASFARPVSAPDTTIFAAPSVELYEVEPTCFEVR